MIGPLPLETVWHALDAGGYEPHGPEHDYRARCPVHQGKTHGSLHISEGDDRRAVIHCFAGCEPEDIVYALGLQMRDLFPLGHRHNRRRPRPRPKPRGAMEVILDGFHLIGIPVEGMWIARTCPYCGGPAVWLRMTAEGLVDAECADGCQRQEILGALETAVAITEARDGTR